MSKLLTELYTISFLIFFAIWGSLARLGLQALTFYPGAPVIFSELWANVAGTFIMGFLSEDMRLFREEWGIHGGGGAEIEQPEDEPADGTRGGTLEKQRTINKKSHGKVKKTIPLYVGLTTGFCGSFTSFSSFVRDVFLGMSNDLPASTYHPTTNPSTLVHRDAGYSVMAILGVIFITVALCFCALKAGAHLAVYMDPITPTLPFRFTRRVVDPLFVVLGIGSWVGAVVMTALPSHNAWRGQALFACVFAPIGCLMRYYVSLLLNTKIPSFPLGTFVCNTFGTAVLGMSYDLQRVAIGGVAGGSIVGCQVLQGIEDGFCGALTTVSTWMLELDTLRRGHAYVYGTSSIVVGLSIITVIMGSVRWSIGWEAVACVT
jgi:fluoride ion exporter CrcB/FEX